VSSASNIAEGHARFGAAEYSHFLSIALGSLAEIDSLIEVACAIGALSDVERATLSAHLVRASRTTLRLQRSVRASARS
jgi:four helix bundle protein